jgi:hypothetical protein
VEHFRRAGVEMGVTRRHIPVCAAAFGLTLLPACSYSPSALESWPEEPSCGRYENLNEPVSADQRQKDRCLLDALASGRPAQLIRTYAAIDGGPITEYYRVLGARRLEVFIDSTQDSEGSQEWAHLLCEEVRDDVAELDAILDGCREISVDEIVS